MSIQARVIYSRADQYNNLYFMPLGIDDREKIDKYIDSHYTGGDYVYPIFGQLYKMRWIANGNLPDAGKPVDVILQFHVKHWKGKKYININIHGFALSPPAAK